MSLNEILNKYNKYERLSTTDMKNIHIHNYKMDKYATMLQTGGYDMKKLKKINTAVTQIGTILNDVHNGTDSRDYSEDRSTRNIFSMRGGNKKQEDDRKMSVVKINGIDRLNALNTEIEKYNSAVAEIDDQLFI